MAKQQSRTANRRRRRSPPRTRRVASLPSQPILYKAIGKSEFYQVLQNANQTFWVGSGEIHPNVNDQQADLEQDTGQPWLDEAHRNRRNPRVWQGDLVKTAAYLVKNYWKHAFGYKCRNSRGEDRPVIYIVDAEAMQKQFAWARACGANI